MIGIDRINLSTNKVDITLVNENTLGVNYNHLTKGYTIPVPLPSLIYGNNAKNLVQDQLAKAKELLQYELDKLNLKVDDLKITYLELNFNINDIGLYTTLDLISKAMLLDSKKIMLTKTIDGIQSLKVHKATYDIKIYKKSEMLRETGQGYPKENILRFEVSSNDRKTLDRLLPNRHFDDIYNNWSDLVDWYKQSMQKGFKEPIKKYVKELVNNAYRLIKIGLKPNEVIDTLLFSQKLVDTYVFEEAFKRYYKKLNKDPYGIIAYQKNRLKKLDEGQYNITKGNIKKLDKLYKEIGI